MPKEPNNNFLKKWLKSYNTLYNLAHSGRDNVKQAKYLHDLVHEQDWTEEVKEKAYDLIKEL